MFYSFKERRKFEKNNKELIDAWVKFGFLNVEKIGSIPCIVRIAQKKTEKIDRKNLGEFYLDSGSIRLNLLKDLNNNISKSNKFYGRTMEELLKLSKEFAKIYRENTGNEISDEEAANIMFINVFDKTFFYFEELISSINLLKEKYPNTKIKVTTPEILDAFAVDIIVYDNNDSVIKALSIGYQENDLISQKHSSFYNIYKVMPLPVNQF